uniref:Glutathione peroxidase n=1 Tax=Knipowitschia caucasica TaxID=637954 RepID=A0AAV2MLC6_KNICA
MDATPRALVPLLLLGLMKPAESLLQQRCDSSVNGTIYQHQAQSLNGSYTYVDLNALHEELHPFGLTILAFPSNQFGKQEPGGKHEILPALQHVRPANGFVPNFLLFEKGDVNGHSEHPVYTFLKSACPPVGDSFGSVSGRLFWDPVKVNDIKWNFEKFFVGVDGKPVMRWHPSVEVSEVREFLTSYFHNLSQMRL